MPRQAHTHNIRSLELAHSSYLTDNTGFFIDDWETEKSVTNPEQIKQSWDTFNMMDNLRDRSRRFSAGMIALRPDQDGVIDSYEGVDAVMERFGEHLIDHHLPPPGTPTQPVEAGYMANAWMRFRHPDYDGLRVLLDQVGETVKVRARRLS